MKYIVLTLLVGVLAVTTFAQETVATVNKNHKIKKQIVRPDRCPFVYITTSTGINNNTGIMGFSFDVPVAKFVSIEGGAGASSWGSKIFAGAKYYSKQCQRGWAFGTGLTHNAGMQVYQRKMPTIYGTERVGLIYNPQTNLLFAAYRYWSLGKKYNRFYAMIGMSVPLSGGEKFDQTSGDPITNGAKHGIDIVSPGGPIAGLGFSFAIY